MGRPRTISDDEILDATMRVVAREGPRRFTLAQVGAEAGITGSGILQRFETKRALLLALSERSRRAPADTLRRARERHAASRVDALIEGLAEAMAPIDTPNEVALSLEYLALDIADKEFNAHARAFFEALRSEVKALLDEAVARKELRADDTDELARAVEVAFNGSVISWAVRAEGSCGDALRHDIGVALAPFRTRRKGPTLPVPPGNRPPGGARASRGT